MTLLAWSSSRAARLVCTMLVLGVGLAACGGTSTDGNGGGGIIPDITGSTPRPPPPQGAAVFTVSSASPAPAGKACPVVTSTGALPDVTGAEALDNDTYQHKIIDGEDGALLRCKVAGTTSFTFEGVLQLGSRSLQLQNGVIDANRMGTADIELSDATTLPGALTSGGVCAINAGAGGGNNFQVKPGSMWAGFNCTSVEAAPGDYCRASGVFVLENCER